MRKTPRVVCCFAGVATAASGAAAAASGGARDRMCEVLSYLERSMGDLDHAADAADATEDLAVLAADMPVASAAGASRDGTISS